MRKPAGKVSFFNPCSVGITCVRGPALVTVVQSLLTVGTCLLCGWQSSGMGEAAVQKETIV